MSSYSRIQNINHYCLLFRAWWRIQQTNYYWIITRRTNTVFYCYL